MNPDGVDLGHWRHNANGVDLNRDWSYYNQPEIKQAVNFIEKEKTNQSLNWDQIFTLHGMMFFTLTKNAKKLPYQTLQMIGLKILKIKYQTIKLTTHLKIVKNQYLKDGS